MNRHQVQAALDDIGRAIGLDGLSLDTGDRLRLVMDETIIVDIAFDDPDERLVLSTLFGQVGAAERRSLFSHLLEGNYFGRHTAGGTLGVDGDSGAIVLTRQLRSHGLDRTRLESAVLAHVDAAEYWIGELAKTPSADT